MKNFTRSGFAAVLLFSLGVFFLSPVAVFAAATPTSATLNGSSGTITVAPGATIAVSLSVTTSGSFSSDDWNSTAYRISTTAPGSTTCVNTPDHSGDGTYVESFNITAPTSVGTYNVYLIPFNANSCGSGQGGTLTLTGKVIVEPDTTAPTLSAPIAITSPTSDGTPNFGFTSSEAGTIAYGGSCNTGLGAPTTSASSGSNSATLPLVSEGVHADCYITVTDASGNTSAQLAIPSFTVDLTPPSVAITQAVGQTDPTTGTTINFTATFSEVVSGFTNSDVTVGGTATGGTKTVTISGAGPEYNIAVALTGFVSSGTITVSIQANRVTDTAGNQNTASNNTDNSVQYNAPTYDIDASAVGDGSITPSGVVSVSQGSNQAFSVSPFTSSILSSLVVDGGSVGAPNSYTFSTVLAPHTIVANFDGGWSAPTTAIDTDNDVAGDTDAFSSNNLYTTLDSSNDEIEYADFGLTVPPGATINGIQVALEGKTTGRDLTIGLSKNNGASYTALRTIDVSSGETTIITGTPTDLWSTSWTSSDFNDGTFRVRVGATLVAGTTVSLDQIQVKVSYTPDTTFPIITIANPNTSPATSKTITAETDEGDLFMSTTESSVCDETLSFVPYASIIFNTEADNGKKVCYKAVDIASNTTYALSEAIAGIDLTPPVTTITSAVDGNAVALSLDAITNSDELTVHFSATDANGIAQSECKLDAGAYGLCTTGVVFSSLEDGAHTVSVRSTDTAGNLESTAVFTWTVDTTPPVITIDPYTLTPTNADITVTASTNEGTLNFTSHTFTENGSFDFIATDAAGNVTTETVTITNIDKVAPIITIDPYTLTPTNADITVTASTNEGTLNFTSHTFTENGSFDFIATDAAGNVTTETVTITTIDNVAPVIVLTGVSPVSTEYGSPYTDLGATVTDNSDGTVVVVVGGDVITPTTPVGAYAVTYNATDVAGNSAEEVVRVVNVTQKTLTITAENKSKVYGEANPPLTVSYDGFENGEDESVLDTPVSVATLADNTSPVGNYPITPSFAEDANYAVVFVDGDLEVTSRAVTVTVDANQSKVYGEGDTALTYTLTEGALADGDSFTGTLLRETGEDVGTYAIGQGDLALPASYTLTFVGNDFEITKRPITVAAQTNTKVYDGTTDAAAIPQITSGSLAFSDTANFSQAYDTKHVGTGKALTATGAVLDGNNGDNYEVTFVADTTGEITAPETLTVSGVVAENKVYDATASATLTLGGAVLLGAVPGDDVALVTVSASGTFADKHVGVGKAVTTEGFTLTGADAGNYTLTQPALAADITTKPLVVSASAENKSYDGNTTASVTLSDDRILGDVLTVSNTTADFDSADVGTGKTVTVLGIAISGDDAGNYDANTTAVTTADIIAASATVLISDLAQTYDGTPKSVTTETTPSGLTVDVTYDASATAPTDAGSYEVIATINDLNYTGTDTQTLVIGKAENAITFGALTDKHFGDADFSVSATATSGGAVTFTASGPCTVTEDGLTVHITGVGSCEITAHSGETSNYLSAPGQMQAFAITDTAAPIIEGTPLDMTVEATSAAGAVVTFTEPTAVDDIDGPVAVVCAPASGTTFAITTTLVTCTATDSATNSSQTTFNVTVQDTTAPIITLVGTSPETIEVGGSYTEQGATTADAVDGAGVATVGGDSVNTALVGTYVVSYSATDAHTNVATPVTRTVNVVDTAAPTATISYDTTTLTNGDVVATLNPSESITVTNNGGLLTHTFTANGDFTFEFKDASDNTGSALATVTNIDKEAPVITLTGSTPVEVTVGDSYTDAGATATDNVDVSVTVNTAGTVDTNTIGEYTLTYSATDTAGNSATEVTRTVNVVDLPAPVITAETAAEATETSVTISWTTDHGATSRVVWDTVSHDPAGSAPNYGYANSTVEDTTLVTAHSVTVTDLTPGTTYYFRAVSHGSPESTSQEIVQMTDSVPPPVDVCSNIEGDQPTIPEDMHDEDGACVPDEEEPVDVCPNIDGPQATIPEGYELDEGQCVLIEVPPTEIVNSCPLPDSLGDTTTETVLMDTGSELNLQGILDDAGNMLDVHIDQKQFQVWHVGDGAGIGISAQHIDNVAGLASVFGYYTDSNLSTFTPLFKTREIAGYESVPLASEGQVHSFAPTSGDIGFAIKLYNAEDVHVGTRATENALNDGSTDSVVVYNTSANTYALAFEDLTDNDFNDLVVEVFLSCPEQCEVSEMHTTVVSDSTTLSSGSASAMLEFIHDNWTAFIASAHWIWSEEPVADAVNETSETFEKTFTVTGTPTGGTLLIAADNEYVVSVNGTDVCSDTTETNYTAAGQDTCAIPAEVLHTGENTLTILVTNWAQEEGTPTSNPAGLMYSLDVVSETNSCDIPDEVDVCANIDGLQTTAPEGTHIDGTQCVADDTPPVTDVCPNIGGVQATMPEGMHTNEVGECVATTPPPSDGNNENQNQNNNDTSGTPPTQQTGPVGNGPIAGSYGAGGGSVLGASTAILPELPPSCTALLGTYMRMGRRNDTAEVMKLQGFLNQYMHANLPVSGFFGPLTDAAVRAFQKKHVEQVLTPWGINTSTGYVYKTTQRWMNLVQCATLDIPMPDLN